MSTTCRCGHAREVHEHLRAGSDCGACGRRLCSSYRRQRDDWPPLPVWYHPGEVISWVRALRRKIRTGDYRRAVRGSEG